MGIFSNLFRGEMLEKTLHYYFLTPMRREMLVAGKYLAGLIVGTINRDGALGGPVIYPGDGSAVVRKYDTVESGRRVRRAEQGTAEAP